MKRLAALLLAVWTAVFSFAAAEEPQLLEDPENGRWEYRSENLSITIERFSEKYNKKRIQEWCVVDIQASPESPLYPVMTDPTKKKPAGYRQEKPDVLQRKANALLALSDDMYGLRLQKFPYYGVIIRDGEVLATKTRNSAKKRSNPNLDTLAVFRDGSMKTFVCDAHTAEEYLEMDAVQVYAFGPYLISEGELNPLLLKEGKKYAFYNSYVEPRVAIGMIEPWHYAAVIVRGRPTSSHRGVSLKWLAEKMQELGCTEALNLDGGGTATLIFNGKVIETGGSDLRNQGSMICFGTMPE